MTYFTFLGWFIGIPLTILVILTWLDWQRGRVLPNDLQGWPWGWVLLGHVFVAVIYTTPWDNYLVATRVWWYDPARVTGIVLGWVPLEEYTFFVVQTLLTGLWLLWLAKRVPVEAKPSAVRFNKPDSARTSRRLRHIATTIVGLIWIAAVVMLALGWRWGTYLALELVWALPPIALQLGFGADILWGYRRLIAWALIPATLYLSLADALAIGAGVWTIDPAQSTGIQLGQLPLEEFIFFFVTNALVVLGMTLVLARASHLRAGRPVKATHSSFGFNGISGE